MNSTTDTNNRTMRTVRIADATLRFGGEGYTFKEKLEIVRLLDRLGVDVVQTGEIRDSKTDSLLCRTAATLLGDRTLSVSAGGSREGIDMAHAALAGAANPRISVSLPVSAVGAEYICHMKQGPMLAYIGQLISYAVSLCPDVEFAAADATRTEPDFLISALRAAADAGARTLTLCDSAGETLPDELADTVHAVRRAVGDGVRIGVECSDRLGMANAAAFAAVAAGADEIITAVCPGCVRLAALAGAAAARGDALGISLGIDTLSLGHTLTRIEKISLEQTKANSPFDNSLGKGEADGGLACDADAEEVMAAAASLGYDLGDADKAKVYESFVRLVAKSGKKQISRREIEAIVASSALSVPPTYRLAAYVINSGNMISSTAHITLEKNGETLSGLSSGDGPIDASFLAIEQIIGHHYELDDFQIQAVTEGHEAMGDALVRLRSDGRLYSGKGLSTDIIGASIRAYISALNKIVYDRDRDRT